MSADADALKSLPGPAQYARSNALHRAFLLEPTNPWAILARAAVPSAPLDTETVQACYNRLRLCRPVPSGRPDPAGRERWPIAARRGPSEQIMVGPLAGGPGSLCRQNLHCLRMGV